MDVNPPKRKKHPDSGVVLVSACLLGARCTHEGGDEVRPGLTAVLGGRPVVPVCPEVAGGLPTPRPRCEVEGGDGEAVLAGRARVRDAAGGDHTAAYVEGARRTLGAARRWGAATAVLKSASPSCGCRGVYDGTHTRSFRPDGVGVTAALLMREGIDVVSEKDVERTGRAP